MIVPQCNHIDGLGKRCLNVAQFRCHGLYCGNKVYCVEHSRMADSGYICDNCLRVAEAKGAAKKRGEGIVQITASHSPHSSLLKFCTPIIVVDGEPHRASWWTPCSFNLTPRTHTIKIFFRHLWMAECGANSIEVNVEAGEVVKVEYYMPPWMFAAGSFKVMKVNL